jgi:hypothetical protein
MVGRGAFHDPRTVAGVWERRKPVPAHIGGLEPMTVMLVDVTAIDAARRHHLAGTERLLRFDHDVSVPQTGPLNRPAANQPENSQSSGQVNRAMVAGQFDGNRASSESPST